MYTRSVLTHVSLAHRYHNPNWDEAENLRHYGDDHSAAGIGANMRVWIEIEGECDPVPGLLMPEGAFAPYQQAVKELLDHRCLFEAEPWFAGRVSTLENVALFVHEKITRQSPPAGRWGRVTVDSNGSWAVEVRTQGAPVRLIHRAQRDQWTVEAGILAPVDPESGLAAIRADLASVLLSTPFRDPNAYFQETKTKMSQLISLRCCKAREFAHEICLLG